MAANYWRGTTDSNWGTATNWSLGAVPTASDGNVATFDGTSPNCTVNTSSRACNGIDFTNYANTITMSQLISVSGNITLGASMIISGSGGLTCNAAATLKSNGKTWPNTLTVSGGYIFTLSDNWTVQNLTCAANAGQLNGNTIYVNGNFTMSNTFTSCTTAVVLQGTGTWSGAGIYKGNLTFNTAGTITISGSVSYGVGTLTYTAGTMPASGSTLTLSSTPTLNTSGMTWYNITPGATTVTLTSDLYVSNNYQTSSSHTVNGNKIYIQGNWTQSNNTIGGTAEIVWNGTGNVQALLNGWIYNNLTINTAGTITFTGNIYLALNARTLKYIAGTINFSTYGIVLYSSSSYLPILDLNGLAVGKLYIGVDGVAGNEVNVASSFSITNHFETMQMSANATLKSNSAGVQRTVTLSHNATQNVGMLNATDIDSSAGQTIWSFRGVLSNATNWKVLTKPAEIKTSF